MAAAHRPVLGPEAASSESQLPQLDAQYRPSSFADHDVASCTTIFVRDDDDNDDDDDGGRRGWCEELDQGRMLYADPAAPGPGKCSSRNRRLDARSCEETEDVTGLCLFHLHYFFY